MVRLARCMVKAGIVELTKESEGTNSLSLRVGSSYGAFWGGGGLERYHPSGTGVDFRVALVVFCFSFFLFIPLGCRCSSGPCLGACPCLFSVVLFTLRGFRSSEEFVGRLICRSQETTSATAMGSVSLCEFVFGRVPFSIITPKAAH